MPQVLNPYFFPLYCQLNVHISIYGGKSTLANKEHAQEKRPRSLGKDATTNLKYSATFWKTEKRFPVDSLLNFKNERRQKLNNSTIKKSKESGTHVSYKDRENSNYNNTIEQKALSVGNYQIFEVSAT